MSRSATTRILENVEVINADEQAYSARQRRGDIMCDGSEHVVSGHHSGEMGFLKMGR
jgi:hypothetical protein